MSARARFLQRLQSFGDAIDEPATFTGSLTDIRRNQVARVLRNGLAIVGFSTLETFLRERSEEIIAHLGGGPVPFADLPKRLREAVTEGAVDGLKFQTSLSKKADVDPLKLIQLTGAQLASTSSAAYELSPLGMGRDKANLSASDVQTLLKILGIRDGWGNIERIAHRTGLGIPDVQGAYSRAMERRHAAAHEASADTQPSDLRALYRAALTIGLGFDVLGSLAGSMLRSGNVTGHADLPIDASSKVKLRFVDEVPRGWREIAERSARATRIGPDLGTTMAGALTRASARGETVVIRTRSGIPQDWNVEHIA